MIKRIILLVVLLFAAGLILAGDKPIALKHITSEEGLSDNRVTCMLRDENGFMWIGTRDGLNRYDGREFYIFRNIANDTASLCSNNITCLAYDSDSILWIGTANEGFCSFDFRTQRFTAYNKSNITLLSNSINEIKFDSSKNALWLALNNGGLQLFDLQTMELRSDSSHDTVRSVYDVLLKDGEYFIAKLIYSLSKGGVDYPSDFGIPATAPARTINKMIAGSDGNIWCGAWDNALHVFDDNAELLQSFIFDGTDKLNFSTDEIISLAEDANRILWCGTKSSGLHFFDLKSKSFINLTLSSPFNSRVYCIYRDKYDRMWTGTEEGLYLYDPLYNQFEITNLPAPEGAINCKVFDRVISSNGSAFIAAACGLFFKRKEEREYHYKAFDYRDERLQLTSIFQNKDGIIFIGTNKTIFMLDTAKIELKVIPSNPRLTNSFFYSIYSSRVNSMDEINIGGRNLLAASVYGHLINLVDLQKKNIFQLAGKGGSITGVENLFQKVFIDSKSRMWICGATRGITEFLLPVSFHPDSFPVADSISHRIYIWSEEWNNRAGAESQSQNVFNVFDILENEDGSFWLTSEGTGLIRFTPEREDTAFRFIRGEYQSLQGIAKQDENNLWIITSKGIVHFNKLSGNFKLYDSRHGMPHGISGFFFNDMDSILSAGFNSGFVSFNPNGMLKDLEKPQVHVTKLWVMDEANDSLLLNRLVLPYNRNFLKFYLSSNCFSSNEQVTYQYQLTGIDEDWRTNGNDPFVSYTNLPPGTYTFNYIAINSDGKESDPRSLYVLISPPFYMTIYFYSVVALLIMGGVYAFYKYRISQLLKIQEVRNKIARDLHDDIGSTIGSINFYSQVANVKLQETAHEEVKSILEKIEGSSREIIDKTGDAVWAANPANDSLKNLVMRMEGYAAAVLGAAEVRFQINCDEKVSATYLEMAERKHLFFIYKEAIHNIIKYASATKVDINISKRGRRLEMTIADNGKGFVHNSNVYNGNGIKNMKARVESMHGTFNITSEVNLGTTVIIVI
jgi:ligand-binding sensor domain-containing protein/two-component sensor histidine kinase